ncbi:MAG TPA: type II secretion system F family protein [Haloplasmataceae bacterium]
MPIYRYRARNRDHYIVNDIMEAIDRGDCVRKLKLNNMVPIEVSEIKLATFIKGKDITLTSGVKKQDLVFFLSQFYNLLHAGLSIIESLKIIIDQTSNKYLKKYLIKVLQDIRNGSSLYGALARQKKVFPRLLVEMIRVGEVIGNLQTVVYDLYIYYQKQLKTTNEIKSALMYPIFLLIMTFVVSAILLLTVVPQFQSTFAQMGKELPFATRLILNFSHFLQTKFIYVILVIILIFTLGFLFYRKKEGKMFFSKLILRLPIVGQIVRKGNLIKIAQSYSTLLHNSVNAIEGLEVTRNILTNQVYIEILDKALLNIQNGIPMSAAFEKHWAVDPVFASMLTVGEESASVDEMLSSIAEYYENEMELTVQSLKKLMEPVIIVIMAVIVGIIVLSILLPMFEMMDGGFA